ncbi:hypothetical protein Tco_0850229 [Tanacetum coccineum]
MDLLNAQPIRYALTVNPSISISCIEQFWSTGVVKTINGEVQLHALVDGKKIIISEASVRRDLQLEDAEVKSVKQTLVFRFCPKNFKIPCSLRFKIKQSHIKHNSFLPSIDLNCNLFDITMTSLADKSLLSGGDNKPPMLEKHLYDSWKSRMELYMMNRPHGRMILASVEKGPLVWPSITEDGVTRLKEYVELTPAEAIQADCDIKAINIILQGLPTEIYALVSQHRVAKDLWEKIKLLMQGTSLTKQERECKLYDEFDKFTYKVKDLHTTNVDQLHAHLQQHERHAIEVRLMHERNPDPLALVASHQLTQPAYQSHLHTHPKSLS